MNTELVSRQEEFVKKFGRYDKSLPTVLACTALTRSSAFLNLVFTQISRSQPAATHSKPTEQLSIFAQIASPK